MSPLLEQTGTRTLGQPFQSFLRIIELVRRPAFVHVALVSGLCEVADIPSHAVTMFPEVLQKNATANGKKRFRPLARLVDLVARESAEFGNGLKHRREVNRDGAISEEMYLAELRVNVKRDITLFSTPVQNASEHDFCAASHVDADTLSVQIANGRKTRLDTRIIGGGHLDMTDR